MLDPRASLKLLVFLTLNLASMQVVDALAPLGRIYRADGSFIDARALAIPIAGYNAFSRKRQADTIGSWALLAGTCPEGTVECKSTYTEGKPCCPSSTTCYNDFSQINCCPTGKSWLYFYILRYFFCCFPWLSLTLNFMTVESRTALEVRQLFPNVEIHPGPCGRFRRQTTFAASMPWPTPSFPSFWLL